MMRPAIGSLYVHVPYCQTICGYCDFYSQVLDRSAATPLVDALRRELALLAETYTLRLDTIFVGGGTPTVLPPAELRRLLADLRACREVESEFTVEANPATVTPEVAALLAEHGVNRVSVGAQSFDLAELRVLERLHQPSQVGETLRTLRAAGIDNINLDLIFAVPGQTLDGWRRNLDTALLLAPAHLSCYGLTYEPGTPLYEQWRSGQVQRADEELEADMFELTIDHLAAAGFEQYEISNFARPGSACRHNLVYWNNKPALGVGPSAAGFDGELRYRNVPDTAVYVRALQHEPAEAPGSPGRGGLPILAAPPARWPRAEEERLTFDRAMRETAMLQLRLIAGIDRAAFHARFRHDPLELFPESGALLAADGLLDISAERVRLTRRGLLLANRVTAELL